MNKIRNFTFYIVLFLVFISCRQHNKQSKDKKTEIIEEIKLMMNDYYNEIKTNGLLAEFKYLDSSDDFSWIPPGYSASISYDSVANILRSSAAGIKSILNTWNSLEIRPETEKSANYIGIITSTVTDTSGKITSIKLIERGTVIKRNDGWKLLSGQTKILTEKDKPRNKQ